MPTVVLYSSLSFLPGHHNTNLEPEVEVFVSDIPSTSRDDDSFFDLDHLSRKEFCQPTFARGIHWNWTRKAEVAIVPCPVGATGKKILILPKLTVSMISLN